MIHEVDGLLRTLLQGGAQSGSDIETVFDAPTGEWDVPRAFTFRREAAGPPRLAAYGTVGDVEAGQRIGRGGNGTVITRSIDGWNVDADVPL
ncbi:hypothetical protein NKH77_15070 [Streptomyces sp. M19]